MEKVKPSLAYAWLHTNRGAASVKLACAALKVNRPGYYRWLKTQSVPRKRKAVLSELKEIRLEHKSIGVWQMHNRLKKTQASYGGVYRLCKENGLMAKRKPKSITRRDQAAQAAEDRVKREFTAQEPMEKLLNDITEMKCKDGKLYLAATLDYFDGAIVGMHMAENKRCEICKASLEAAVNRYGRTPGMIIHSDHGSQYTSRLFRRAVAAVGGTQSMGRTGSCYDNARMESFFATLKKELIYRLPLSQLTREAVKRLIFRWIECDYNTERPHSGNSENLPPLVKRRQAALRAA
ncbi:MAG: IS3 family transposase [Clostridia bacterium]